MFIFSYLHLNCFSTRRSTGKHLQDRRQECQLFRGTRLHPVRPSEMCNGTGWDVVTIKIGRYVDANVTYLPTA